jgi:hypothetical protein
LRRSAEVARWKEDIATLGQLIVCETGTTTRILARIPDIQLIKKILVQPADLETIAAEVIYDSLALGWYG